ncbi:Uncharacterised protein [Raoultella planticola]|nr:Uncharacterised protein [Raoultella planticola]
MIDGVLSVSLDCVWHLRCLLSTFTRLPDSAFAQNRLCGSATACGRRLCSDESQSAVRGVLPTPRCSLSPAFLSMGKPSRPVRSQWHDNAPCRPTRSIFLLFPSWSPPCCGFAYRREWTDCVLSKGNMTFANEIKSQIDHKLKISFHLILFETKQISLCEKR